MINAQAIRAVLGDKASTFAGIEYKTKVPTAAKHKHITIEKYTTANVQLFANVEAEGIYTKAVKKAAGKIEQDQTKVAEFQAQDNYFEHTDCYSIVEHKTNGKQYLYAVFNNATSTFTVNGKAATRDEVAGYLTPSAAEKLLGDGIVYNKANDILHTIQVRTIALENIAELRTNGVIMV